MTDELPAWAGIIRAAEAWGMPPWAVGGLRGKRRLWYHRWRALHNAQAKRDKVQSV